MTEEMILTERAPISVVIPAYNSEDYIREAIESVRAQSLPVSEIIVVDDGSTDTTSAIASGLGAVVIRQPNRGVCAARNAGIRAAGNEWIGFIDQDDLWKPEKIESQWAAIQARPDVGIVSCRMTCFADESIRNSSGIDIDVSGAADSDEVDNGGITYFHRVTDELPLSRTTDYVSGLLIRRDLLLSVGMFDERLRQNEDLECFLRLIAQAPLAIVETSLVLRRIHGKNTSLNYPEDAAASYQEILDWLKADPHKYPAGAARVYNKIFAQGLISEGRVLLEDGQTREARALFTRSLARIYSYRALFLWCLSFLGPPVFKYLLAIKRTLAKAIG